MYMRTTKKDIEEIMENLEPPTIDVNQHQREFRMTSLNTKKSAVAGVILLILPFLFLSGVILKHYLNIDLWLLTSVYEWIGNLDRLYGDNSIINWIIRILLLFGPLIAIGVNLISITHIRYEKNFKEIVLSFKLRWQNILIILICTLIFSIFFIYIILENLN